MSSSRRRRTRKERVRWIQHYNNGQKILLVGEGDFSFSACLARAFRSAVNMVATSLHSQGNINANGCAKESWKKVGFGGLFRDAKSS
ncbi:hypothetical protein CsSME_00026813 [Camellia sinensis var. sinensis]